MTIRFGIAFLILLVIPLLAINRTATAGTFTDALSGGTVNVDFRLRHEHVDQDTDLKDADALTLRTRLGYTTGEFHHFSAVLEFEDSRDLGVDDYNDGTGSNPRYSVVADPETTELDQLYLQFRRWGAVTRLGRQVITLDNHRFIGDVGWRQDRQTFDAFSLAWKLRDHLSLTYAYIDKRNRIFADDRDLKAKDHLFNVGCETPFGTLTGYGYFLEEDEGVRNDIDSYGIRFNGSFDMGGSKALYTAEFSLQDKETDTADFDAHYYLLEAGAVVHGITLKAGYEVLGSDNGKYGFSTPLATLHKFNGWADRFLTTPAQGLADLYISLGGELFGGKWKAIYHDFKAEDADRGVNDLGREINLSYSIKFLKHYDTGIKYAAYSAGDPASGTTDTDKLWIWFGASF